jgi:hypothetical protein
MIKSSSLLVGIHFICFVILQPLAFSIPPNTITKKSGNIMVEVKQISVVVGGDPFKAPTGWRGFKDDGTSLAFVKFRIRIFKSGKMFVSDTAGPYSYRNGELPEVVEIKNLDKDKDLEVRIDFRDYTGAGNHRTLFRYNYDWNPSKKKYKKSVQCYYQNQLLQC